MMSSRSLYRSLPLVMACVLSSLPMTAQAVRSYQVDLVIFTLQTPETANSEQWLDAPPPLDAAKISRAISPLDLMSDEENELDPNQSKAQAVVATEEKDKDINFKDVLARLKKDPRRKIVLTTSWIQPVQDPGITPVIHITDRIEEPETELNTASPSSRYNQPAGLAGMPIEQGEFVQQQPPLIDGFVNFYLSSYYTLEVDLRYTPELGFLDMDDPENPEYTTYRIYEKRRMKSDELNYYDHPKFGALLLVNPAAVAESAEEASQL